MKRQILSVQITVNGESQVTAQPAPTLLIDYLRVTLNLTGTHQGCDTAQCGACTVLVNDQPTKSCNLLLAQTMGSKVTTIESLAKDGEALHPMQQAFSTHHALQCGYCTPGFVMRAVAMAQEDVPAEPAAVRHALSGNLCRCTGYEGIVTAICEGMKLMRLKP
jgi:aerobic carbon-monoxide dehydrogenase small subunit